jgi:hypothetical protein
VSYRDFQIFTSHTRDYRQPAHRDFESTISFLAAMVFLGFIGYLLFHYIVPYLMDIIVDFFCNHLSWEELFNPYD